MSGKRLQVTMSEDFYNELHALAKEQGIPVGELIRQSVSLKQYVRDRQKAGETLVVRSADKTERELVTL